jgi:hypothetical protein
MLVNEAADSQSKGHAYGNADVVDQAVDRGAGDVLLNYKGQGHAIDAGRQHDYSLRGIKGQSWNFFFSLFTHLVFTFYSLLKSYSFFTQMVFFIKWI